MPSFDKAFEAFVNWQTVVFCLGIYVITYMIRRFVESVWKGAKDSNLWTEFFLHAGPIGTGMLLAVFSKKFPWPMPIADSGLARFMYGGICGMASGWVYGRLRAWLKISATKGNTVAAKIVKTTPASGNSDSPPADTSSKTDPAPPDDDEPETPKPSST